MLKKKDIYVYILSSRKEFIQFHVCNLTDYLCTLTINIDDYIINFGGILDLVSVLFHRLNPLHTKLVYSGSR